jgi:uncharacterized protein (DUF2236 family)
VSAPLNPDGLIWKYFGRLPAHRLANGLRMAMLQNMHPELAAGVELQSVFFDDPLARGRRSIGPIMSVVYGGANAAQWGKMIRGFHSSINGVDRYGRPYNALNPDTFFWAHATFVEDIVNGRELTGFPLCDADKQALYLESIEWYRLYGVSMKPVPPDWDAFRQYWEYIVTHVLEDTRPVREGFRIHRTAPAPKSIRLSERANAVVGPYLLKPLVQTPLLRFMLWLTVGAFPPQVRDRLCLDWTALDELRYRTHLKTVHAVLLATPDEWQYLPVARAARRHYRDTNVVAPIPLPVSEHDGAREIESVNLA